MGHYPDRLLFRCEVALGISFQLERQNGSLAYAEFSNGEEPETKKRFTPDQEHWEEFWSRVDFLGVWDWRDGYASEETGYLVRDGMSWELEIENDGKTTRSEGSNAYPSFESIGKTSLERERFGFLHMSLEALVGDDMPEK